MRKAHVSKRPTKGGDDIVSRRCALRSTAATPARKRRPPTRQHRSPWVLSRWELPLSDRLRWARMELPSPRPLLHQRERPNKSATKNVAKDPLDRKGLQIELQQRVRAGGASRRSPPRGLLRPNLSEPQGSTKPNRCRPLKLRRRESWKARVPPPNLVVGWRLTADDSGLILARAQEVDQGAHRVAVRRPRVSQAGGGHGALE